MAIDKRPIDEWVCVRAVPPRGAKGEDGMNEPWKVTLLGGGLRAERGQEHRITRFYTYKYGALLAYLAYYRERALPREVLIEMLWPETGEKQGRNSLSQALSSLRHQLEPPGTPASAVLRADRFSVSVNPAALTTDVAEFEREITAAATASGGSAAGRREHLTRAVASYRGRLLPGYYEDWILGEQERLSGLFFDAAGRLIGDLEEAGDLPAALACARQAVAADPLREEGEQHLIRLLAGTGQPGAALRQFREFERLLLEDTGDEPSPALRALIRQVEEQAGDAPTLAAPALSSPGAVVRPAKPSPVLPGGGSGVATVTFLLTDIEGSTGRWEQTGEAFRPALERHHALLREEFARWDGQEVKEAGDGFLVAFAGAGKALACAVACQTALVRERWPEATGPLSVRMALHTGDVETNEAGEYHGLSLHRASRILGAGHGGQILVSEATAALVRRDVGEDTRLTDLGVFRLRDVPTPERLFQVEYPEQARPDYPALRAEAGQGNTLPLQFTRFFGREQEVSTLRERLLDPAVRLLTVTGPGGTGKTRLSLAVAERLMEP
jgi:class 3 adenylate cyclase